MDLEIDQEALQAAVGDALPLQPLDAFTLFVDTAALHRQAAIERGFSPESAEAMAVALHAGLVAAYFMGSEEV